MALAASMRFSPNLAGWTAFVFMSVVVMPTINNRPGQMNCRFYRGRNPAGLTKGGKRFQKLVWSPGGFQRKLNFIADIIEPILPAILKHR